MKSDRVGPWIAALAGLLWCASYVTPLIDPTSLDAAFRDDWSQHSLGFMFYRHERAGFPLGKIRSFLHPIGTTLGYMDAIPWVALLLRPFSRMLPLDFQYLGLWLLLCSATLAYGAARIARGFTPHWEQQALAGLLVAMAPMLIERIVHPALCAHIFIVAAIGFNLVAPASRQAALRALALALGLVLLAAATHPYHAVMSLLLAIGAPIRLRAVVGLRAALAFGGAMLFGALGVLFALGYVGGREQNALSGFGAYSANLNTFFNSMGHSRLVAALPTTDRNYEGYCYLGVGVFFLALVAIVALALPGSRARVAALPWRRIGWPLTAASVLAMYALATPIRWGTDELGNIGLYASFDAINQSFRSSGRFVWALAYLLNVVLLMVALRAWGQRRLVTSTLLMLAVAVQAYDVNLNDAQRHFSRKRERAFDAPEWSLADKAYRHLVLYPTEIVILCESRRVYRGPLMAELAYLAYRHRMTFNSGYAARYDEHIKEECERLQRQIVEQKQIGSRDLVLVAPKELPQLRALGATCGYIDRVYACVQPSDQPFARYLEEHPEGPADDIVLL